MKAQGHGHPSSPTPATPVGHGNPTPVGHKHHKPVHHDHHVKRTQTPQHHRQHPAHRKHPSHKSAPRGSLPVETQVQAMLWFVDPARC